MKKQSKPNNKFFATVDMDMLDDMVQATQRLLWHLQQAQMELGKLTGEDVEHIYTVDECTDFKVS